MLRKHLVIVGGGWGGLSLARKLKNVDKKNLRITLISDDANFRYSPGLYRVATGHREREAIIPIGEVISDLTHIDFVKNKVINIDRAKRTITIESGKTYHYDYAVLALGTVTSYFDIPGLEKYSYGIKSVDQLRLLRSHLHQSLVDDGKSQKSYVVVGAGPTGVELAAALGAYVKLVKKRHGFKHSNTTVEIVEGGARVSQTLLPKTSAKILRRLRALDVRVHLGVRVEAETETTLQYSGKSIPTNTVIWTAGMSNNPFFKQNEGQFALNDHGRVEVDEALKVDEATYVIGDNAATPYSGLAFTAVHNAKFVAKDIERRIVGKNALQRYKPLTPVAVIPVGSRWAILQYKGIIIGGFIGACFRVMADLIGYTDVLGIRRGVRVWSQVDRQEESCKICKTALEHRQPLTAQK